MTKKRETVYLHGYVYWAKVFGPPKTNYNEDGREWGFEFEPDEDSEATVREHGLGDRFKDKFKANGEVRKNYEERDRPFLNLRRNEFKADGEKNEHIRVVDADNHTWNDKTLLGNKTEVDLKVQIVDYGKGKKKGIYPLALRVLSLVPYEREEFAPLSEDDPRRKAASERYKASDFEKDFGLEEDAPEEAPEPDTDNPDVPEPELDDDVPLT